MIVFPENNGLGMFMVYYQPELQPPYRARLWNLDEPTEIGLADETLEGLREKIQNFSYGMYRLPRNVQDAPEIIEIWL